MTARLYACDTMSYLHDYWQAASGGLLKKPAVDMTIETNTVRAEEILSDVLARHRFSVIPIRSGLPVDIPRQIRFNFKLYQCFYLEGITLRDIWLREKARADLETSIRLLRTAISLCPPSAAGRDGLPFALADALAERYKVSSSPEDLQQCIDLLRESLELRPASHVERPSTLNNLALALNDRYARFGKVPDLEECVRLYREALVLQPDSARTLNNLANALGDLYEVRTEDNKFLDECIQMYHKVLTLRPEGHPRRSDSLNDLAVALGSRYNRLGDVEDQKACIDLHREALALRPEGHPDRDTSLNNLALTLRSRYTHCGMVADLDTCIGFHLDALALRALGNKARPISLNNLAIALNDRYSRLGDVADLEHCICAHKEALSLYPDGHPSRSSSLSNLAAALNDRYARLGSIVDLNSCICYHREALDLRPMGHLDRRDSLTNLGEALMHRYTRSGYVVDLEKCVQLHQEALDLYPKKHPNRSKALNNLANALNSQYARFGEVAALEECIRLYRDTLHGHNTGDPDYTMFVNNLAGSLSDRYMQLRNPADLKECIRLHQKSIHSTQDGHPNRTVFLSNLADSLAKRYECCGRLSDLDISIRLHERVLLLRPEGHPSRDLTLNNLSIALIHRHVHLRKMSDSDLEASILRQQESLSLQPQGNPHRPLSLNNLGNALSKRYMRFGCIEDLEAAISHLRSSSTDAFTFPSTALSCAFNWIDIAEEHHHDSLAEAFMTAVASVRQYLSIGPTTRLQYAALLRETRVASLPVDAAAYFIEKGNIDKALELLDEGRALLISEMRRFRDALLSEDRAMIGEELSTQYLNVCNALRDLSNSEVRFESFSTSALAVSKPESSNTHQEVAYGELLREKRVKMEEYADVLQQIRQRPGCEDFQKSLRYKKLQQAAKEGPVVVINCSKRRSDIVILFAERPPLLIPLREHFQQDMKALSEDYLAKLSDLGSARNVSVAISKIIEPVVEQLWISVVQEVVETLQANGVPQGSRIWWCPTSFLTSLPFHAAGCGSDWLIDHYISSYTPTLSTLIGARQATSHASPPRILAVAQTVTSGLKNAGAELQELQNLAAFHRCLDEEDATPRTVAEHLSSHNYNWAHFICHGTVANDPFESYFHLSNGSMLTLNNIMKLDSKDAKFAFLATCHSAGQATDRNTLRDEVLHLAAAMQVSGFRSVVGTLWQMEDKDGPPMARKFYEEIFGVECVEEDRHAMAADALWKAVQWLRNGTSNEKKPASLEERNKEKALEAGEKEGKEEIKVVRPKEKKRRRPKKKQVDIPMARWANYIHIGA